MPDDLTLAEAYRRFGQHRTAAPSPLSERVAAALGESDRARHAIAALPAGKRRPALILAVLHDLALAGRAPALAAAYAGGDADAAAAAAIDTLLRLSDAVAALAVRRSVRDDETGRHAVLYPAIAEAARRAGASAVGLIDVGRSAGLNLGVDRAGITYGNGQRLGDSDSAVQVSASIVGDRPIPTHPIPEVTTRVVLDRDPIDVTNPDDARWLQACLPPDQPERAALLAAELTLAADHPPLLRRGDPVQVLAEAVDRVPADALPIVSTTWALSAVTAPSRARFVEQLAHAGAGRLVMWVSVEGVGVAPGIPTLGDRPASGHSLIGLAAFDSSRVRAEAVGRCWSRGRLLSWFADH